MRAYIYSIDLLHGINLSSKGFKIVEFNLAPLRGEAELKTLDVLFRREQFGLVC